MIDDGDIGYVPMNRTVKAISSPLDVSLSGNSDRRGINSREHCPSLTLGTKVEHWPKRPHKLPQRLQEFEVALPSSTTSQALTQPSSDSMVHALSYFVYYDTFLAHIRLCFGHSHYELKTFVVQWDINIDEMQCKRR